MDEVTLMHSLHSGTFIVQLLMPLGVWPIILSINRIRLSEVTAL